MGHAPAATEEAARDRELVRRALDGEGSSVRALVDRLAPAIQGEVGRALLRYGGSKRGRNPRQEVEDLTQQVFLCLIEHEGRALRTWDPDRGRSLPSFVALIARRTVWSLLRTDKHNPWTEDPTLHDELMGMVDRSIPPSFDAEAALAAKEIWHGVLAGIRARVSPKGLEIFYRFAIEEQGVDEIASETGMTAGAVYAWRSRLTRLARSIAAELFVEQDAR